MHALGGVEGTDTQPLPHALTKCAVVTKRLVGTLLWEHVDPSLLFIKVHLSYDAPSYRARGYHALLRVALERSNIFQKSMGQWPLRYRILSSHDVGYRAPLHVATVSPLSSRRHLPCQHVIRKSLQPGRPRTRAPVR